MQSPQNTVLLESEPFGFKVVRLPCFIQVWGELCLNRDVKSSDCGRLRSNKKIGSSICSPRVVSSLGRALPFLDFAGELSQIVTEIRNYRVSVVAKNGLVATQRLIIFPKEKIGTSICSVRMLLPNSLIRNALDFSGELAQIVTVNWTGSCKSSTE